MPPTFRPLTGTRGAAVSEHMRRYDEVASLLGRHNMLVFAHDHVRWDPVIYYGAPDARFRLATG